MTRPQFSAENVASERLLNCSSVRDVSDEWLACTPDLVHFRRHLQLD